MTDLPRPEYPRPQFVRPAWMNLNGEWEFAFDDANAGLQNQWQDGRALSARITVPFPYQSQLSGINDKGVHVVVWYARSFEVPAEWKGQDVLLHFGAVDYRATVWVNGECVGHNSGGHVPFWFNISGYLREGENRLTLRVEDRQDPSQPRGKQSSTGIPHGIDYYCTTGIWQTVWLEPTPPIRIHELDIDTREVDGQATVVLRFYLHAPFAAWRLQADLCEGEQVVAHAECHATAAAGQLSMTVRDAKLWSPETPHLYALRVRLYQGEELLDSVESYVGIRYLELRDGHIVLNGKFTYLAMVLDQGYWPDSLLAAPSDDALRADVEWAKKLGFNGARKHQKIEDPRWLYWCDKLGLLVWGEMPNARAWSSDAEEHLLAEWRRAVRRDYNHPCIITWVPVNESMGFPELEKSHPGQYAFLERIVAATRRIDPNRPVIDNDGWEHTDITDICAIHDYTPTADKLRSRYATTLEEGRLPTTVWADNKPLFMKDSNYRGQPVVLTEVGGFLLIPPDVAPEEYDVLYRCYDSFRTPEELQQKYRNLMEGIASLEFIAGFCYTQLTDIDLEINGLLTYDRKPKVDPEIIAEIHRSLFAPPGKPVKALRPH